MWSYALRRLLMTVPLVVIVACLAFGLVYLMPGNPAATIAGDGASAADIAKISHQLGLDRSFFAQFGSWMGSALHGNLGTSFMFNVPVTHLLAQRVGVTTSIVVVGLVFSILIGIPAGLVAGLRPGSITDRVVTSITTLGISVPAFWLAMLLIGLFAISLGWFNATGYTPITHGLWPWFHSLILPGLSVAATSAADIARQTRSSVAAVVGMDHVRTSRAMGLRTRSINLKHVLRNSGVPVATVTGFQIQQLIGAAVVVELLFGMPGIGQLTLNAVLSQDIPTIQGATIVIATVVIVVNLLVDLSYAWINPQLRKAVNR